MLATALTRAADWCGSSAAADSPTGTPSPRRRHEDEQQQPERCECGGDSQHGHSAEAVEYTHTGQPAHRHCCDEQSIDGGPDGPAGSMTVHHRIGEPIVG
jgi:hypothetical protein